VFGRPLGKRGVRVDGSRRGGVRVAMGGLSPDLGSNQEGRRRPDWRAYQRGLQLHRNRRRVARRLSRWLIGGGLLALVIYAAVSSLSNAGEYLARIHPTNGAADHRADSEAARLAELDRMAVRDLLARRGDLFFNLDQQAVTVDAQNGESYRIVASLDLPLQTYLLSTFDKRNSRYVAIVVMEPKTGRILSMVGFDKTSSGGNLCTSRPFPAASIFKIVTATAAIEKCGLGETSKLAYNGRKHTLYRSQLKKRSNRYTNRISLKRSFAESVNPVFGKLGEHYLGKSALESYSAAFGFNHRIDLEIPVVPSKVTITDDPYELAEIASGFNRSTTISPLHGALMGAAVVNRGTMSSPTVVARIDDAAGRTVYRSEPASAKRVMSEKTSQIMAQLMRETVRSGTGRKTFRGYRRDAVLAKLDIGGKTGSIDNKAHDARIDWFVGFAKEKNGNRAVAVGVVVAHEEFIGIRAGRYARMAMHRYFQQQFANDDRKNAEVQQEERS
jgi:peptidoglycan glycosyltransferase